MVRVKLKRIETSISSIISIRLSTSIFGLPIVKLSETLLNIKINEKPLEDPVW